MPERASRETRQTAAVPYGLPLTGNVALMVEPPPGQTAVGLRGGDLLMQQVALISAAKSRLQPVALQLFAGDGSCCKRRLVGGRNVSRHAVSVAAVTPSERDTQPVLTPPPLRRTSAATRRRRYARFVGSLRVARPRSNVALLVHDSPLSRKSSACEMSQSTVGRRDMRGMLTSDWRRRPSPFPRETDRAVDVGHCDAVNPTAAQQCGEAQA